ARSRDYAESQGATEAHLIAAGMGQGTTRLNPDWEDILKGLPEVGRVMALTRNKWAVHEKIGTFDRIMWDDERPVVLDPNINLRINLKAWAHGFAVEEQMGDRIRHSLHVYDPYGVAVIKVYLQADANVQAFRDLVEVNKADDQSRDIKIRQRASAKPPKDDGDIDARQLESDWRSMSDTHDVFALSRRFGATRVQTYRLAPEDLAREVDKDAFSRMLQTASVDGEEVMIFVASPGNVQIHIGPVHKVERRGPWQNVLDPEFNLHLMERGIASCWVITKPTMDGDITSLEIFDAEENQIAWIFGKRKPGNPQSESWRAIIEKVCPSGLVLTPA
ncbi:MAG: hemin-degrading factor, partial [Caulobacteraceae bacterium]